MIERHAEAIAEIRALARAELVSFAGQSGEHNDGVDRRLLRALGEVGLLPRIFPAAHGGSGEGEVSAVELCLLREGLACETTAAETALALQGLGAYPILQNGGEKVVAEWIPPVARGEAVPAFALTEPDAGSDAAAIALTAERDGDAWRLTGTKTWISNAPDADVYTVFARTDPQAGSRGVTAFVVPGDAEGLSGQRLHMLAPHAMGRLEFDGVHVPVEQVLGDVGGGFRVAMRTLDLYRPCVGACAVGMAQAALEAAVAHAGTRKAFDRPLRDFQGVSHQLADMATRTQAARLMVYEAAAAYDADAEGITSRSAMAKLFATEVAQYVVDAAVQIHGASGLERGHLLEHLYREVRATRIYEGSSEIQRNIIARELYT